MRRRAFITLFGGRLDGATLPRKWGDESCGGLRIGLDAHHPQMPR